MALTGAAALFRQNNAHLANFTDTAFASPLPIVRDTLTKIERTRTTPASGKPHIPHLTVHKVADKNTVWTDLFRYVAFSPFLRPGRSNFNCSYPRGLLKSHRPGRFHFLRVLFLSLPAGIILRQTRPLDSQTTSTRPHTLDRPLKCTPSNFCFLTFSDKRCFFTVLPGRLGRSVLN